MVVRLESLDLVRVWRTLLVFAGCVVVAVAVLLTGLPGGTTVIGTLYPDVPWDETPTLETIPDHELKPAELEALAGTLRLSK